MSKKRNQTPMLLQIFDTTHCLDGQTRSAISYSGVVELYDIFHVQGKYCLDLPDRK